MKVTINRHLSSDEGVFGVLSTDGFKAFSLELPYRENKIGVSCIPAGTYRVEWLWSPKHERKVYHVQNVPGRTMVELHSFNLAGDADKGYIAQAQGCISLGEEVSVFRGDSIPKLTKPQRGVTNSAKTVAAFEEHMKREPFDLEILWDPSKDTH